MLGTIIEQNGDGLLEQSHMPVGWPLHIDGAVRQSCAHRDTTLQELDDLLGEYDLKRDLVEINRKAPQGSHNAVWNKRYMEPKPGFALQQLWADSESAVTQKTSPSYEVKQKVPQPSKPTWVSVQDVVLNSLDRPRNQVNYSQSSATFTKHTSTERCLAHVAMVLVGVSRLDTK